MNSTEPQLPEWFCLRCQTKREHIAAGHLRELEGVEVFCPRLRYRKATRRGKIWWVEPMFPGYLLAKFNMAEMERAVTFCQGIRGLVRFGSEIPPVPESFVEAIKHEIRNRNSAPSAVVLTIDFHEIVRAHHNLTLWNEGNRITIQITTLDGFHTTRQLFHSTIVNLIVF